MSVGGLKWLCQIQSCTYAAGDLVWQEIGCVFGKIEPMSGKTNASQNEKNITHRLTVRVRRDMSIKAGMRVINDDRVFVVHGIREIDDGTCWQYLYVEENVEL